MAKRKMSTFERLQRGHKLSRRERKQIERQFQSEDPGWEIVHHHVAAIDVGNESHFAAVDGRLDAQPVREFGSWTAALRETVEWLKSCGVQRVVMQTTGVYWIALQDELERAGLEVAVVDARGTKNLPGRKTDVQECQWLRKLDVYGLLRECFQVPEAIRSIRTVWRLRERWVKEAGRAIQQMQKALTIMNVQLANAISDISGKTGMAILRAILKGERNPWTLAKLRDERIQASEEEIAHSLEGNWRVDVLFELQQVVQVYDFQQQQIAGCDQELEKYMKAQPTRAAIAETVAEGAEDKNQPKKRRARKTPKPRKNQPAFALEQELQRVLGVDLTRIDGIKVMTAQTVYAELGSDLSAFPSEGHFTSWLLLAPKRDVSGGKVIRHYSVHGRNRVANALRMAAESLKDSDSYLGARYRSLRGRLGGLKAVKAMARYLACLIYRMLTKGQAWVDRGAAYYEQRRQERELSHLHRKAAALGMQLVPVK
ncbi:MAG TPA: IS110 family transposase [Candidatus Angelobacter sp.]|jgi:transposase|nr:IS110 family transposase [Candidatus Angelobacter sp.]